MASSALWALVTASAGAAMAASAPVLPTGFQVAAGQAGISQSGSTLTVSQSSGRSIIDWSSFSIGAGQKVQFNNGSGATLNRVLTGGPLSQIDGALSATGSVYLINGSGVIVGKSGVISVGGNFVASTLNLSNAAFLAGGGLTLSGSSRAAVINYGKIGALGGDIVLSAARVTNAGTLTAANGEVGLLAGTQVLLRDQADLGGKFAVQIGGTGTSVVNSGDIAAAAAELRAENGNIYALAGNTQGVIRATEVSGQGGQIQLTSVGGAVDVAAGAVLDASAGQVAGGTGVGGHVYVDSAATTYAGTALATGGPAGGAGGLIETSGTTLNIDGAKVNTGRGGQWLLDPTDLTIDATAATAIDAALNGGSNVTLATSAGAAPTEGGVSGATGSTNTSGSGDIFITSALSWTGAASLTFNAYRNLNVEAAISLGAGALTLNASGGQLNITAPITVSGAGSVNLSYNTAATTNLSFGLTSTGFEGSINYGSTNQGGALTLNGQTYKLIYNLGAAGSTTATDFTAIDQTGDGGYYALATPLTATQSYTAALAGNSGTFGGTFEGLGNTISGLTISAPSSNFIGLFGNSAGVIRDVGVVGVSATGFGYLGGLVGDLRGGSITSAYATGTISGAITNSNAYYAGGLVGYMGSGSISDAYANDSVSIARDAGGLVGWMNSGSITEAYTTGEVQAFLIYAGGIVGLQDGGSISNVFSTSPVLNGQYAGGIAGLQFAGSITNAYAAGKVYGGTSQNGGLVGGQGSSATATNAYYDTLATGNTSSGDVNIGTGLTTTQLQGALPTGFSSPVWATGAGLYPYLTTFYPNGVQAVSGIAYIDAGITPDASSLTHQAHVGAVPVTLTVNGVSQGVVATAANGYYYFALPAAFSGAVVTSTTANATTHSVTASASATATAGVNITGLNIELQQPTIAGNVYSSYGGSALGGATVNEVLLSGGTVLNSGKSAASTGAYSLNAPSSNGTVLLFLSGGGTLANTIVSYAGANLTGVNLYGGYLNFPNTSATTLSAALSGLSSFVSPGAAYTGDFLFSVAGGIASLNAGAGVALTSSSPTGFTVDQSLAFTGSNGLAVTTAAGGITLADPVSLASGALALSSAGSIAVDAPVTISGAGTVNLTYNTADSLSFAQTASGTGITYGSTNQGGSLAINGSPYQLIYNLGAPGSTTTTDFTAIDSTGDSGHYALATSLIASQAYSAALAGASAAFTGTFEGLGNTISGLTISKSSVGNVGLFGASGGVIRNLGLIGGSVTGAGGAGTYVGALVGKNSGVVENSYASAAVTSGYDGGGLVGYNTGMVEMDYATGAVNGSGPEVLALGGLVGVNFGTVKNTYATGAVYGEGGFEIGGLVGDNGDGSSPIGTLTSSYATGAVSDGYFMGGLVGNNTSGVLSNDYWDTQTSGQTLGFRFGSSTATGLATAQFQSGSASGLGAAFGGGTGGLYPDLVNFFPNGLQAVSGVAYSNAAGTTLAASGSNGAVTVGLTAGGVSYGSVTTGANGYYYVALPAGAVSTGGSPVLAYTTAAGNATNAATFNTRLAAPSTTGVVATGFNILGSTLAETADASINALSGLNAALTAAAGSTGAAALSFVNQTMTTAASSFEIDVSPVATSSGVLTLSSTGSVTQGTGAGAAITAGSLSLGGSGGAYSLTDSANSFSTLAANTGAVGVASDAATLTVGTVGGVSGVTSSGAVTIAASGATGNLTLKQGVTAGSGDNVVLSAVGAFTNSVGSSAVTTSGGGVWDIYSAKPSGDTFGALNSNNTAVWNTAAGASVSVSGDRYIFAYQPTLTITTTNVTKTYGDDATAKVAAAYSVSGFQSGVSGVYLGDSAASLFSGAPSVTSTGSAPTAGVAGGPYAITASQGSLTLLDGYALGAIVNAGVVTINPAALTITADNQTKLYGAVLPTLTASYSGFVNGETSASLTTGPTLATTATSASHVAGSPYAITASGAADSNYSISYVAGLLSVTPAALTITADNQTKVYGAALPNLTASYTGLVNGDTASSLTTGATLATTATSASHVAGSPYAITASSAVDSDYSISYVAGALSITPAALAVTASSPSMVYGSSSLPTITASYTGLVNGDTASSLTTGPTLATTATAYNGTAGSGSHVGSYATTASGAVDGDYSISYVAGTLSVTPATLTITANNQTTDYRDPLPTLTASYTGLVNGDTSASLTTAPTLATTATSTSKISRSPYPITVSGAVDSNYTISYVGGLLYVRPPGYAYGYGGTLDQGSGDDGAPGYAFGNGGTLDQGSGDDRASGQGYGYGGRPAQGSGESGQSKPSYSNGGQTDRGQ